MPLLMSKSSVCDCLRSMGLLLWKAAAANIVKYDTLRAVTDK